MMTDFKRFEKLSSLYVGRYLRPVWKENDGFETNPWWSLRLFLEAAIAVNEYERQP